MDESWALSNVDLIQQIGTLMWATSDDKAPEILRNVTAARVGYELYSRFSGEREMEALRNQTILAIAKFIKEHPKATKEEIAKEVAKQITLFSQRVEKL